MLIVINRDNADNANTTSSRDCEGDKEEEAVSLVHRNANKG